MAGLRRAGVRFEQTAQHGPHGRAPVQPDQHDHVDGAEQRRQLAGLDEHRQQESVPVMRDAHSRLPFLPHPGRPVEVGRRDDRDHPVGAGERGVYLVDEVGTEWEGPMVEVDLVAGVAQHMVKPAAPALVRPGHAEKDPPCATGRRTVLSPHAPIVPELRNPYGKSTNPPGPTLGGPFTALGKASAGAAPVCRTETWGPRPARTPSVGRRQ